MTQLSTLPHSPRCNSTTTRTTFLSISSYTTNSMFWRSTCKPSIDQYGWQGGGFLTRNLLGGNACDCLLQETCIGNIFVGITSFGFRSLFTLFRDETTCLSIH